MLAPWTMAPFTPPTGAATLVRTPLHPPDWLLLLGPSNWLWPHRLALPIGSSHHPTACSHWLPQIAETVLTHDCSQSCTCRGAGGLQCRAAGCPFGQSCGLADGTRSCVDQPGRCTLAPASRFISFDGIAAAGPTMATGIYVVAFLCDTQQPAWFRLLAQVGEDQDRPVVVALHLYSPGAFVTVRRDKKVWVGCPHPTATPQSHSRSPKAAEIHLLPPAYHEGCRCHAKEPPP